MPALLSMAPELLVRICCYLEMPELKQFRGTSRICADLVAPMLFNEVHFDLEPGGCENIVQIALQPELGRLVRTLHFARRRGLKSFNSFESWEKATIYEWEHLASEVTPNDLFESEKLLPDAMKREEWDDLPLEARNQLFEA